MTPELDAALEAPPKAASASASLTASVAGASPPASTAASAGSDGEDAGASSPAPSASSVGVSLSPSPSASPSGASSGGGEGAAEVDGPASSPVVLLCSPSSPVSEVGGASSGTGDVSGSLEAMVLAHDLALATFEACRTSGSSVAYPGALVTGQGLCAEGSTEGCKLTHNLHAQLGVSCDLRVSCSLWVVAAQGWCVGRKGQQRITAGEHAGPRLGVV